MRGFLSYWLQKKFIPGGSTGALPEKVLAEFCEAYNLQMDLVTPDMR